MPTALITGITGQDGSYLAEHLLAHGYKVVGLVPDLSRIRNENIGPVRSQIEFAAASLLNQDSLEAVIAQHRPSEIYNLAARASSKQLVSEPVSTGEVNGLAVAKLLEAVKVVDPRIRFCQASSSEIFGRSSESPQNEDTAFRPRNPYGVAKLFAHGMVACYREHFGLFACSAILFNHESPRRGIEFVTRKITLGAAQAWAGRLQTLSLGSLEAKRDWGYAADYVRGMWLMLQASQPSDYVLATGEIHSVREFCNKAFGHLGLDYRQYVRTSPQALREPETVTLVGDARKARELLRWAPSISFDELVEMMVAADVAAARAGPDDGCFEQVNAKVSDADVYKD